MKHEFNNIMPDSWYYSISLPTSWELIHGRLSEKKVLDIGACTGWVSWQ